VTGRIPAQSISVKDWHHLQDLPLADPTFADPGPIDILLGANIYGHLLRDELRKGALDAPVAQSTHLGWIVSGPAASVTPSVSPLLHGLFCSTDQELHQSVHRFWLQEEVGRSEGGRLSKDDELCEAHFKNSYRRDTTGRYIVRLPFKREPVNFGDSHNIALRMLKNMHRRFRGDPGFHKLYLDFLEEYENLGHMERIESEPEKSSFYMPHHGVLRQCSTTTKLRVVFNASQKTNHGVSLNDFLHAGPNIQNDLVDVIVRWRLYAYVFTADVEKMFRQIIVHPEDRNYQMILWSRQPDEPPDSYQLSTVTYGTTCAPFLANRVMRQLADDEESRFPEAAKIVRRNMFVDDVLRGGDSVKEAQERSEQVDRLLAAGGFNLQKWTSNEEKVLSSIESRRKINVRKLLEELPTQTCRALGLSGDPHSDAFVFRLNKDSVNAMEGSTKRSVLSLSAKLFDPIGWLAPITITAKIFLQKLWRTTLGWDDPLPQSLLAEWKKFAGNLARAEAISIPRWLRTDASSAVQLHGFSDASQDAIAAVVYLRMMESDFTAQCSLVMAKTKVAPLKKTTIARLELSAAVLLSQLVDRCRKILDMQDVATHLWSDSSVTLTWIAGQPSRWKEYVANRVELIHDLMPNARWHHVPGVENPTDIASRGSTPEQLLQNPSWWKGPSWLAEHSTSWPISDPQLPASVNLEERSPVVSSVVKKIATWDLAGR